MKVSLIICLALVGIGWQSQAIQCYPQLPVGGLAKPNNQDVKTNQMCDTCTETDESGAKVVNLTDQCMALVPSVLSVVPNLKDTISQRCITNVNSQNSNAPINALSEPSSQNLNG